MEGLIRLGFFQSTRVETKRDESFIAVSRKSVFTLARVSTVKFRDSATFRDFSRAGSFSYLLPDAQTQPFAFRRRWINPVIAV